MNRGIPLTVNKLVIQLSELSKKLLRIESKIDSVRGMLRDLMGSRSRFDLSPPETPCETHIGPSNKDNETLNVYLLKFPDSLRPTMFALDKLKEAAAFEIAGVTGRSRSLESLNLNQLQRMGYLVKSRIGKRIYFRITDPIPNKGRKSGETFL